MRRVLMTVGIVLFASNAWAGVTCTTYGNTTTCFETGSSNSGTTTCTTYGNTTTCF